MFDLNMDPLEGRTVMRFALAGALSLSAVLFVDGPVRADSDARAADPVSAAEQFEHLSQWVGRWTVDETDRLTIVFEGTANGRTIVERWETANGLHSITVYHMDGEALIATHYCPQGNQPRLASHGSDDGVMTFAFRDATDLGETENYQHDLSFAPQDDGTLVRSEVYWGPQGAGSPSRYTLRRAE